MDLGMAKPHRTPITAWFGPVSHDGMPLVSRHSRREILCLANLRELRSGGATVGYRRLVSLQSSSGCADMHCMRDLLGGSCRRLQVVYCLQECGLSSCLGRQALGASGSCHIEGTRFVFAAWVAAWSFHRKREGGDNVDG